MAVTQQQFIDRFKSGISGAGEKYKQGVQTGKPWAENYSSTESQQRMRDGLAKAIDEGRPAAGAQALGTAGYRAKTVEKSGNYTGAAARAAAAITPHVPQILQAGEAARAAAEGETGPKNRDTAARKMVAAMNAIKDAWGKD